MKHWQIKLDSDNMTPVISLLRNPKIFFSSNTIQEVIDEIERDKNNPWVSIVPIEKSLIGVSNFGLIRVFGQNPLSEEEKEELKDILEKKLWLLKN